MQRTEGQDRVIVCDDLIDTSELSQVDQPQEEVWWEVYQDEGEVQGTVWVVSVWDSWWTLSGPRPGPHQDWEEAGLVQVQELPGNDHV